MSDEEETEIRKTTKTNFQEILGSLPKITIIDFFIENPTNKWEYYEIQKNSNVSPSIVKIILPELVKVEIIKVVGTIKKRKLYRLNDRSQIAKKLIELRHVINQYFIEEAIIKGNI